MVECVFRFLHMVIIFIAHFSFLTPLIVLLRSFLFFLKYIFWTSISQGSVGISPVWNVFILLLFSNENFPGYKILHWQLFSLHVLKISLNCLLASVCVLRRELNSQFSLSCLNVVTWPHLAISEAGNYRTLVGWITFPCIYLFAFLFVCLFD